MDNRKTTAAGQLRPMVNRLTTTQAIRRALKEQRRAWGIRQMSTMTVGRAKLALQILGRGGFGGRLEWLVTGR